MPTNANTILALLHDIEEGDPIDFGDLPLDENAARDLVAIYLAKFSNDLASEGLPVELREQLALATTARVVLDNLALQYRILQLTGAPDTDLKALLKKLGHTPPAAG